MAQQTVAPSSSPLANKIAQISARLEKVDNPFTGSRLPKRAADNGSDQPWSKAS